jgi:hypothetical protein
MISSFDSGLVELKNLGNGSLETRPMDQFEGQCCAGERA